MSPAASEESSLGIECNFPPVPAPSRASGEAKLFGRSEAAAQSRARRNCSRNHVRTCSTRSLSPLPEAMVTQPAAAAIDEGPPPLQSRRCSSNSRLLLVLCRQIEREGVCARVGSTTSFRVSDAGPPPSLPVSATAPHCNSLPGPVLHNLTLNKSRLQNPLQRN